MRKWSFQVGLILLVVNLAACAIPATIITKPIWPDFPPVPPLPALDLKSVQFSVPNANSIISLDYDNWSNLQYNLQAFKLREQSYQERISEINKQRQYWQKLNEEQNVRSNSSR